MCATDLEHDEGNRMKSVRQARRERRGSVMFAALAVVLTVTVLASCLLQLSSTTAREQTQSIDTKRAFYLAESGLSEAWYGIKIGKSGNIGTADLPATYGDGLLWVEAEDIGQGRISLTSTGLVGSGRFSLSMVVERDGSALGAMGVFADQEVTIGEGVLIDSYDSSVGPYVAPDGPLEDPLGLVEEVVQVGSGSPSRVGSNGDIVVHGSLADVTTITGDVQPGPSGSVVVDDGVTIAGSTAPASQPFELPEIDVPTIASKGDMTVGARGSLAVLPTGESAYGLLRVPTGRSLTIHGPTTLVVERFRVEAGGQLVLDAALGPIEIYTTQELTWADGAVVTCQHESPTGLSLLVSASQDVDRDGDGELEPAALFRPTGAWLGTLYAPHSALAIAADTEVFGAVAARSLELENGVRVHYDEALASAGSGANGELVVSAWRVVELPDVPLVNNRTDPLVELQLRGVVVPKAADAHEAVMFKIRFMDWTDVEVTWSGDEAKFDWLLVKTVIEVAREGDGNFDSIF